MGGARRPDRLVQAGESVPESDKIDEKQSFAHPASVSRLPPLAQRKAETGGGENNPANRTLALTASLSVREMIFILTNVLRKALDQVCEYFYLSSPAPGRRLSFGAPDHIY